jgi:hypothetical protein
MKAFVNTVQWMCQVVCNNVSNISVLFSRVFMCMCVCVFVCDGLLVNPKYAALLEKKKKWSNTGVIGRFIIFYLILFS